MNQTNVPSGAEAKTSTRQKILDAAEKLFADNGFDGTSLRMITAAAGANLAAVNYHFRSKDDLVRAVYDRRLRPLNQARMEALEGYLGSLDNRRPELEAVLRAFLAPAVQLRATADGAALGRLLGRTYSEVSPVARQALFERMRDVARPFTEALRRALPGMSQIELLWKLHFAIGVMAHTMGGGEHLKFISGGMCDLTAADDVLERVIAFVAAGMRAPAPAPARAEPNA
jgi:AcrR family transcriptional regulator